MMRDLKRSFIRNQQFPINALWFFPRLDYAQFLLTGFASDRKEELFLPDLSRMKDGSPSFLHHFLPALLLLLHAHVLEILLEADPGRAGLLLHDVGEAVRLHRAVVEVRLVAEAVPVVPGEGERVDLERWSTTGVQICCKIKGSGERISASNP